MFCRKWIIQAVFLSVLDYSDHRPLSPLEFGFCFFFKPWRATCLHISAHRVTTQQVQWLYNAYSSQVNTTFGKTAFSFSAPYTWNILQLTFKLNTTILTGQFKTLITNYSICCPVWPVIYLLCIFSCICVFSCSFACSLSLSAHFLPVSFVLFHLASHLSSFFQI